MESALENLKNAWTFLADQWKSEAMRGRLPIYRNWTAPLVDLHRGESLHGLSALLLAPGPWLPGVQLSTNATGDLTEPFGWRACMHSPEHLTLIPYYRNTHVAKPAVVSRTTVRELVSADSFLEKLGYKVGLAPTCQVEGYLLLVPQYFDPEDRIVKALQLCLHSVWARREHKGYLGAEMLFGMIANFLGLDTSAMTPTRQLVEEILGATTADFANNSLRANTLCFDLLGETGLDKGFRASLSPPFALAEAETEDSITISSLF